MQLVLLNRKIELQYVDCKIWILVLSHTCVHIPNFDSLLIDEKWIFVSTVNDHYASYVLCSFVAKSFVIRKSLINN